MATSLWIFGCLFLGGTLLVSSLPKLANPTRTAGDIQNYRILPHPLAAAYGWALAPLELASGLTFLSGYGAKWGALVALVLLTSFMTAVAIAMYRKQDLTCTCFGLLYRERVGWNTQTRDGILWLLAAAVFLGPATPTFGDLVTSGSLLGYVGAALSVLALIVALFLGWVAAKGWPLWVVRLRMRGVTSSPLPPVGVSEAP
jgi:hypothetical protein